MFPPFPEQNTAISPLWVEGSTLYFFLRDRPQLLTHLYSWKRSAVG